MALSLEAARVSGESLPVIPVEGAFSKLKDRQNVASMLRGRVGDSRWFCLRRTVAPWQEVRGVSSVR
jgi:hypothetical protein